MKRYGDISHYRAPYKDSVFSGFGAATLQDAVPSQKDATKNLPEPGPFVQGSVEGSKLNDLIALLLANSKPKASGVMKLSEGVMLDILMTALATATSFGDTGTTMFPGGDRNSACLSLLAKALASTGRADVPGFKMAAQLPPKLGAIYLIPAAGKPGSNSATFWLFAAPKELTLAEAGQLASFTTPNHSAYELLGAGEALPAKYADLFKKHGYKGVEGCKSAGLSTASMLGYGALGLVAVGALAMLLKGKKKPKVYSSNPRNESAISARLKKRAIRKSERVAARAEYVAMVKARRADRKSARKAVRASERQQKVALMKQIREELRSRGFRLPPRSIRELAESHLRGDYGANPDRKSKCPICGEKTVKMGVSEDLKGTSRSCGHTTREKPTARMLATHHRVLDLRARAMGHLMRHFGK